MARSRGQRCWDIELAGYLANAAGPVPLVLGLRIAHERWGSSSNPSLNGQLHYPADLDRPLNEAAADKILQYRADIIIVPLMLFLLCLLLLVRLDASTVSLCAFYFCRLMETERFLTASGFQLA